MGSLPSSRIRYGMKFQVVGNICFDQTTVSSINLIPKTKSNANAKPKPKFACMYCNSTTSIQQSK